MEPIGEGDRVTILGTPRDAQKVLHAWREIFRAPGVYQVQYLAKAKIGGDAGETEFETWFLKALYEATRERFVTSQEAIWLALDDLLRRRGVQSPSELDVWELRHALFDLGTASTARMVGVRVPRDVAAQLMRLGFSLPEVLDFPALAYRMGLIYDRLAQRKPVGFEELKRLAGEKPLSSAERAAIQYARQRAGVYLQPIYDETGRVWTAERELLPLRRIVTEGLAGRKSAQEMARELAKTQRAQGVIRDAERVIRTEIAEARGRGAWQQESKRWSEDTLIYRQTAANPCRECLRLFKLPNGMPRLYRKSEVEAADALGYNRGPRSEWHVRQGPIHPHCLCAPFRAYHEGMESIFESNAPRYAELMRQLKVGEEAA